MPGTPPLVPGSLSSFRPAKTHYVDKFEFFVEAPPVSQQTRNRVKLPEWKDRVRGEAAKLWGSQGHHEGALKPTVVYYHEGASVLIDHDNMFKPIQDALCRPSLPE